MMQPAPNHCLISCSHAEDIQTTPGMLQTPRVWCTSLHQKITDQGTSQRWKTTFLYEALLYKMSLGRTYQYLHSKMSPAPAGCWIWHILLISSESSSGYTGSFLRTVALGYPRTQACVIQLYQARIWLTVSLLHLLAAVSPRQRHVSPDVNCARWHSQEYHHTWNIL